MINTKDTSEEIIQRERKRILAGISKLHQAIFFNELELLLKGFYKQKENPSVAPGELSDWVVNWKSAPSETSKGGAWQK